MIIDRVGGQPKDNLGKLICIWQALSAVTFRVKKSKRQSGLSLRAEAREFSPATKRVAPGYFYWKIGEREIPSRLIPCLLVVFTRQLEILETTLTMKVWDLIICLLAF